MSFDPAQEAKEIVGETEFYEFDLGEATPERYTSSRKTVASAFGVGPWRALPIFRGGLGLDQNTAGGKIRLAMPVTPKFVKVVAEAGLDVIRVRIIRGFGVDYANDYRNPWFIGHLTDIDVGVNAVNGNLVSIEGLFESAMPRVLYGPGCQNVHFGPVCGLDIEAAKETHTIVSVSEKNRLITTTGGSLVNDDYTSGFMRRTTDSLWRSIIMQAGNQFVLHIPLLGIVPGMQVYVAKGCLKRVLQDCRDKWGNKNRFVGMPLTPKESPVVDGF